MAYITCKHCGCQMSDKSEACPICGASINDNEETPSITVESKRTSSSKTRTKFLIIGISIIAITAIIVAFIMVRNNKKETELHGITLSEAYLRMEVVYYNDNNLPFDKETVKALLYASFETDNVKMLKKSVVRRIKRLDMAAFGIAIPDMPKAIEFVDKIYDCKDPEKKLEEQKRIEEERQKAEKETENLISEIKRQIHEALKNGTIHDLMTPDFKSAEKAAMEAQARNGIYFDVDIFYHTQDELPDIIDVSEVNLINKDKAYVKVMYVFRNDWGNSIDNTTLFVIRDKQASNSKWLVDDIVELKEGIVSYSEKASMHEFAAEDSEWRQYVVIDGSGLRLRLEPSTDADTFKWPDGTNRHPKVGDKFTYLGEYGDFYKIDFNGNALWVSKEYTHIETENQTSQNNDDEQNVYEEDEIYQKVDDMPSFPGGETKLMEYVGKNLKYPQEAREKGVQGRVFVGFVVEPDGSISDVKLLRGIGGGCDEEAIRVVKSFPKWKPGKHQGKFVRVSYMLPVNFKLA